MPPKWFYPALVVTALFGTAALAGLAISTRYRVIDSRIGVVIFDSWTGRLCSQTSIAESSVCVSSRTSMVSRYTPPLARRSVAP